MSKPKSRIKKELTAWRDETAKRTGLEKYKILSFNAINQIAELQPASLEELQEVKGIGPVKLKQYGRQILDMVQDKAEADSDQEEEARPGILSVSEFLDQANELLADNFSQTVVQGEVSSLSRHPTGIFFTLQDEQDGSVLNCYVPPRTIAGLDSVIAEGMQVRVTGEANIYKPRGKFTLVAAWVEPAGEGSLKKAYELLKSKLDQEGLFVRKRALPEFIQTVGLVTSRQGAAIDDFCRNLDALGIRIEFCHVAVEGSRAVDEICAAVHVLGKSKLDALVITRGGGSLEDLQAFNSERVARAVFASRVPTVCGIGHEKDVPFASLVADAAVSTPTAAAVRINDSWRRLREELPRQARALDHIFASQLRGKKGEVSGRAEKLGQFVDRVVASPGRAASRLERSAEALASQASRYRANLAAQSRFLQSEMEKALAAAADRIDSRLQYIRGADPERNLRLGYTITQDEHGRVLKSAKQLKPGDQLTTRFTDGEVGSQVIDST